MPIIAPYTRALNNFQLAQADGFDGTLTEWLDQQIAGPAGPIGPAFKVDATGLLSARSTYESEPVNFAFLATDNGNLYLRVGVSGWSNAIPFRGPIGVQGPPGDNGKTISLTLAEYEALPVVDPDIQYFVSEPGDDDVSLVIGQKMTNLVPVTGNSIAFASLVSECVYLDPVANLAALTIVLPPPASSAPGLIKMVTSSKAVAALTVSNGGNANTVVEGAAPSSLFADVCYAWQCRKKVGGKAYWRRLA